MHTYRHAHTFTTHTRTQTRTHALLNLDCHSRGRDGSVQGFFCLPPLILMQCFCVIFLEGSGQSPVVFYSVKTGINGGAAKDMANARLLCMFAITIIMEIKDH